MIIKPKKYNSNLLKHNINSLILRYPFLNVLTIGYSVLGRPIYCLKFGSGLKEFFYLGGTHANEWITSILLMKFLEDISFAYYNNYKLFNFDIKSIFNNTSIYIIPMLNPDGVNLVNGNLNYNSNEFLYAKNISKKHLDIPFPSGWKANINGVDLNLQFPAGWKKAREIKYKKGFTSPAPRDFVGSYPLSEPESLALYNFTMKHNFDLMITYHTQGKEIYWQFKDYAPKEAYDIGLKFSKVSNYKLADVPYASSFAGYKDWFLQEFKKPAFTIEAGFGENPLPISQFDKIYRDNIKILLLASSS